MKKTKNYLYITTESYGGFGGIAQYNRDLLQALSLLDSTHSICVIQRIVRDTVTQYPSQISMQNLKTIGKLEVFRKLIELFLSNHKIDEIVCGHINLLPAAVFAKFVFRAPISLLIYGIDAWNKPKIPFISFQLKKCKRVISISNTTSEKFLCWATVKKEQITILHNAIHLDEYENIYKKNKLLETNFFATKKIIITLGRISSAERYKGFDEVIESLNEIKRVIPNILYIVAGDGDDLPRLKKKVKDLELTDQVFFTGKINDVEKKEWLSLADLFVMPSYGEGFGFVVLEALASGTPVVASKIDGTREAIKNGELGTLINPHSKEELINAVLSALGKKKNVPSGIEYFSFEKFSERVSLLYLA